MGETTTGHQESPSPPPAFTTPSFELNPGTIEDLHKQCQNVFPMFFEGAKFLVNKVGSATQGSLSLGIA